MIERSALKRGHLLPSLLLAFPGCRECEFSTFVPWFNQLASQGRPHAYKSPLPAIVAASITQLVHVGQLSRLLPCLFFGVGR
jgi:hypothetical protein